MVAESSGMYLEVRQGRASVDLGPRWSVEAVHFLFRVLQDTHGHSIGCTPIHPLAEDPVVISKSRPHMLHRGAPAVFSKPFHVSPCGGPWPRVRTPWTPWPRVLNRLRRPLDLPTSRARVPPRRPAVKPAVQIFVAASVGALSIRSWSGSDRREILERTVRAIADRAHDAYRLVEEAHAVDPKDESGLVAAAKRLRMELLQTKAELERELGRVLLHCRRCNRRVHWVSGVGSGRGIGHTQNRRRKATSRLSSGTA
jgi:hypothetical protein